MNVFGGKNKMEILNLMKKKAANLHENKIPTIAFLDIPKRLPISDVDNPLPVSAFNFFSVALSQPLLILQNPCYTL